MNKKLLDLLLRWPKPYITGTDLHFLLGASSNSRYGVIKRAIQQGYLVSIRRDLYLIKKSQNQLLPNNFEIAMLLQGPSYISFESALSFHGQIPEGVRTIACASTRRKKEFDTILGFFSYEHIPLKVFSIGVETHLQNGVNIFVASCLKALADMIYIREKNWSSLQDVVDDLRIEMEFLKNLNRQLLKELIEYYPCIRVKRILKIFQQEIKS